MHARESGIKRADTSPPESKASSLSILVRCCKNTVIAPLRGVISPVSHPTVTDGLLKHTWSLIHFALRDPTLMVRYTKSTSNVPQSPIHTFIMYSSPVQEFPYKSTHTHHHHHPYGTAIHRSSGINFSQQILVKLT